MKTGPARKPIKERFWAKVSRGGPDECWAWNGSIHKGGYGQIFGHHRKNSEHRTVLKAHRVAWEIHHQKLVPEGLYVCHTCDVRSCVNPAHLWLGTHADNMADCVKKGRIRNTPCPGERHGMARLTEEQAKIIKYSTAGRLQLAAEFGVHKSHVDSIRAGRAWKYLASSNSQA